jgi:hypothetical protein
VCLQGKIQKPAARPSLRLPIPSALALVAAAGLGVFSLAKTKRPVYYTVEEGDTLCTIGECYSRDYADVFKMNTTVVEDPDIIYPGDRCVWKRMLPLPILAFDRRVHLPLISTTTRAALSRVVCRTVPLCASLVQICTLLIERRLHAGCGSGRPDRPKHIATPIEVVHMKHSAAAALGCATHGKMHHKGNAWFRWLVAMKPLCCPFENQSVQHRYVHKAATDIYKDTLERQQQR